MHATSPTTFGDCVFLILAGLIMALVVHFTRSRGRVREWEISTIQQRAPSDQLARLDRERVRQELDKFHWTVNAFAMSWLPYLLLTMGLAIVSLLRDHGWQIIPWPILINLAIFGCSLIAMREMRLRSVLALVKARPDATGRAGTS